MTSPRPSESASPTRPPLAPYAGAWVALWAVYSALYAANGIPVLMASRGAVAAVLPTALFGLVSLGLARRWPWPMEERWRLLTRVLPALLGLALASTAGWILLFRIESWLSTGADRPMAPTIVVWQTVINLLIHIALAGVGYAWHTADALRRERERAARADVLRARAELQLLRSQLHPHFVLNVLHALLGLVRRDPQRAEATLERLGDLLRFGQWVHQSAADFVPLSREWDFVQSYLDLERVRLGDRLSATLDADETALAVPVPPFALQPLVENAIIHAIAPRASGGRVEVAARRSGGTLRVCVTDDGPGVSDSAIAASPRMGLRLLQERLNALYAGRARLVFESPSGGGFRACLELPDEAAPEPA